MPDDLTCGEMCHPEQMPPAGHVLPQRVLVAVEAGATEVHHHPPTTMEDINIGVTIPVRVLRCWG